MANEKRLIDAEPIKKFIVAGLNNPDLQKAFGHDAIEILAEIEYAPAVEAVEVVRCKDCEWWVRDEELHDECRCGYWKGLFDFCKPNDFCSYGERREGE